MNLPLDNWFDEDLVRDHELGRHETSPLVRSCPDCSNERLQRESQEAIRDHERKQRGE